jgi:hypothetical protein
MHVGSPDILMITHLRLLKRGLPPRIIRISPGQVEHRLSILILDDQAISREFKPAGGRQRFKVALFLLINASPIQAIKVLVICPKETVLPWTSYWAP